MYRQGLGDCFLLTYSDGSDESHLLIDCGVLKGTAEPEKKMQAVAQNVHEATNGHLDRLVVTHEHWDHLSGFLQAQTIFDTVEVGEVWLALDRGSGRRAGDRAPQAQEEGARRDRRGGQARGQGHDSRRAAHRAPARRVAQLPGRPRSGGDEDNRGGARLGQGSSAAAQVPAGPASSSSICRGCPALRIYVLGPPHDRRLIKRSDPSKKHPEVYELVGAEGSHEGFLAAAEALADDGTPETQPFDDVLSHRGGGSTERERVSLKRVLRAGRCAGGASTTTGSATPERSRWRSTPTRTTRASCSRSSSRAAAM